MLPREPSARRSDKNLEDLLENCESVTHRDVLCLPGDRIRILPPPTAISWSPVMVTPVWKWEWFGPNAAPNHPVGVDIGRCTHWQGGDPRRVTNADRFRANWKIPRAATGLNRYLYG
jgi:hypothetical protein